MAAKKKPADLGAQILATIGDGSVATPVLATALAQEKGRVYRTCRRLENDGFLASKVGGRPMLYCRDCETVVTKDKYQDCQDEDHDLRSFSTKIIVWALTPKGRNRLQQAA